MIDHEPKQTEVDVEHLYGERVQLAQSPILQSLIARLAGTEVRHPELVGLLRTAYVLLSAAALGDSLPQAPAELPTRMQSIHPREGIWRGSLIDPKTPVVVVDIVRGGIVPAQTCFELLTAVLPDESVRLDHLSMSRTADAAGSVTGVELTGSKIGGSIENSLLVLPDPMGATGSTLRGAVNHYVEHYGQPRGILAMPLIATPEFLREALSVHPRLVVHAGRVDRGLSPPDVLAARPGLHWDRERGLDERGYIVPGAGGMGEVLNNAWC
jgi:uracil phosphoribosyltransferase